MKTYIIVILTLIMFVTFEKSCLTPVFSKETEKSNKNDPLLYQEKDGIKYYLLLAAQGDYSRLKLVIRSEKKEYKRYEPVYIRFYVRNDSDNEVHIWDGSSTKECISHLKLFYSNYNTVHEIRKYKKEF